MTKYYLTKMQHSPTTMCLTDERILQISGDTESNWVLHNEGQFFLDQSLAYGTLENIQNYIKEQQDESNKN